MIRIKDYYNWERLEQWKQVLETGNVSWKDLKHQEVEDSVLSDAVLLLKNDCFPTAIVCCCDEEWKKEILGTPLWSSIFSFLDGRRSIQTEYGEVCFQNMDSVSRKNILNARISSIWLKAD